jgi:hypothetical protein
MHASPAMLAGSSARRHEQTFAPPRLRPLPPLKSSPLLWLRCLLLLLLLLQLLSNIVPERAGASSTATRSSLFARPIASH